MGSISTTKWAGGKVVGVNVMKPMGAIMRTFSFTGELGSQTLDLNLQPGVYTCNFYLDGQFVENQTIVIIE